MGKILSGKRHGVILAAALFLSAVLMAGCGGEKEEAKVRDLEFTVVGQNEVPRELQEIIEQKKKEPLSFCGKTEKAMQKLQSICIYRPTY